MTAPRNDGFRPPPPVPPVADPTLTRPDWTRGERRDPRRLWLDKNENTDPELAAVVRDVIAGIDPTAHFSYPESAPLYRKLAAHLSVAPENLLMAAGSDGVIRSVFEAYVDRGDVVLHTQPTFAMYPVYSAMYGADARPVAYRATNAGPGLTARELTEAFAAAGPKLVCLPNPDSPTGTMLGQDDLRAVIEAAGRAGALILIDEAYYPFSPYTALPWIADYPHLVVARSTGKAWGLAGMRIGYAAASPEVAAMLHKVRPMYETSSFAMAVFEAMLDRTDAVAASVARLIEGKRQFLDAMAGMGFATLRGEGNFLHVAFGRDAGAVHAALADLVYYRAGFAEPCLKGYSRFSAATPAQLAPVIARIRACVTPSS